MEVAKGKPYKAKDYGIGAAPSAGAAGPPAALTA